MAPPVKREDLIVPYIHVKPPVDDNASSASFVSQSMPMAAMFMRNKLLSWFAIFSAVVGLLYELHGANNGEGSAYLRVLTGLVGVGVCYMELALPGSAAGPQVKRASALISETASAAAAAATST